MKMNRRTGQRVLNIIREAETIQQIRLLPRLQLVQRRIKLTQGFRFDIRLLRRQRIRIGNRLDPQQPLIAGQNVMRCSKDICAVCTRSSMAFLMAGAA